MDEFYDINSAFSIGIRIECIVIILISLMDREDEVLTVAREISMIVLVIFTILYLVGIFP